MIECKETEEGFEITWDPDGIDEYEGVELDLGQCFEQIIINRTINALDYK